ncbi:MAG TPA: GNAT family N-acetyltransferase [Candidatus Binataceae bacterium]|nr:GNAT family N-acetyltransferase [Candidatus Binataceae bacterium]
MAVARVQGTTRPEFTEKTFYLEEFYGKSLLFALIPPAGESARDLRPLLRALRELHRNHARCIVIVSHRALPKMVVQMGRMAPAAAPPVFDPARGRRSRPYPPDAAVAAIWQELRAGSTVVAGAAAKGPAELTIFAQELASRLRVFKLILLDRQGGLLDPGGQRLSFLELRRIGRMLTRERAPLRRGILRAAARALRNGVGSVNLTSPRGVYEELLSFVGTGTLLTEKQYGSVRPVSIDDFEEVEALIERGQNEGVLLPRSPQERAALLPSCFGYRVGDEHLAGVCSLLTEPYRRERAGEITALYTLTRFAGEGVAVELVKEVLNEARSRGLSYAFACTGAERAAHFFARLKFRRVTPAEVPAAKWRGYDRGRRAHLIIFRFELA